MDEGMLGQGHRTKITTQRIRHHNPLGAHETSICRLLLQALSAAHGKRSMASERHEGIARRTTIPWEIVDQKSISS